MLKYIAGRFRDQQDAVFLLRKKGLVNRNLIRQKIKETIGPADWAAFAAGLQRWYDPGGWEDREADRLQYRDDRQPI